MQVTEQPDYALLELPWPGQLQTDYYCAWTYACQCPGGTQARAQSGPLSQICLCDSTGSAAVLLVKLDRQSDWLHLPDPAHGIPLFTAAKLLMSAANAWHRAPATK